MCVSVCEERRESGSPLRCVLGGPGMFTVVCVGVPLCTQVCVSGVLGPGVSQVCVSGVLVCTQVCVEGVLACLHLVW